MGSPPDELGRPDARYDKDAEPRHDVTLSSDYYMGIFEVSQRQWELVMGNRPSRHSNDCPTTLPVEQVSYYEIRENPLPEIDRESKGSAITPNWPQSAQAHANSFVGKLRSKTGLMTLDLPTEAQWERACRAGTTTALNSGKNLTSVTNCPNLTGLGCNYYGSTYTSGTTRVGSNHPNAWGLYNMHDNVSEWCLDWYTTQPSGMTDPPGGVSVSYRVLKGGSWGSFPSDCRSASRTAMRSYSRWSSFTGFRLACTLNPPRHAEQRHADTSGTSALLAKAQLLAAEKFGTNFVRGVELIQPDALAARLPACTVFRVFVFNPRSAIAGRSEFDNTLVFDDNTTTFIDNGTYVLEADKAAADLLSKKAIPIDSPAQLRQLVVAFAELKGITLQESIPDHPRARKATSESDWDFKVSETSEGWDVTCVFLVDSEMQVFVQRRFSIRRDGRIELGPEKFLLMLGGGYANLPRTNPKGVPILHVSCIPIRRA